VTLAGCGAKCTVSLMLLHPQLRWFLGPYIGCLVACSCKHPEKR